MPSQDLLLYLVAFVMLIFVVMKFVGTVYDKVVKVIGVLAVVVALAILGYYIYLRFFTGTPVGAILCL